MLLLLLPLRFLFLLLLIITFRRFTQIFRLCTQVLWLGYIVHHDVDFYLFWGRKKKTKLRLRRVILFFSLFSFLFFSFSRFSNNFTDSRIFRIRGIRRREGEKGEGEKKKRGNKSKRSRLTFNFRYFFVQHMDWPFFQRTVAVIVVLLHEASRHFFDQHLDKFFFFSLLIFTL